MFVSPPVATALFFFVFLRHEGDILGNLANKMGLELSAGQSFSDYVYDNSEEFESKHSAWHEGEVAAAAVKAKAEGRAEAEAFVHLSDERKSELEGKGFKYSDLESFAVEVGANRITDGLIARFEKMGKMGSALEQSEKDVKGLRSEFDSLSKKVDNMSRTATAQSQEGGAGGEFASGERQDFNTVQSAEKILLKHAKDLRHS